MSRARTSVVATWTLTFAVIGYCVLLAGDARLRLQTPGRFATEPADWYVLVRLAPADGDRWLKVEADGTAHYTSSVIAIEGERSWHLKQVWFEDLPGGCYDFRAELRQVDEQGPVVASAEAPWPLSVSGPGMAGDVCSEADDAP